MQLNGPLWNSNNNRGFTSLSLFRSCSLSKIIRAYIVGKDTKTFRKRDTCWSMLILLNSIDYRNKFNVVRIKNFRPVNRKMKLTLEFNKLYLTFFPHWKRFKFRVITFVINDWWIDTFPLFANYILPTYKYIIYTSISGSSYRHTEKAILLKNLKI